MSATFVPLIDVCRLQGSDKSVIPGMKSLCFEMSSNETLPSSFEATASSNNEFGYFASRHASLCCLYRSLGVSSEETSYFIGRTSLEPSVQVRLLSFSFFVCGSLRWIKSSRLVSPKIESKLASE